MLGIVALAVLLSPGPTIEWQAESGCTSPREIADRVRTELQDAPAGPPLTVRARVLAMDDGGWRMEMSVIGGEFGESTKPPLDAPSCDELADEFVLRAEQYWLAASQTPVPRDRPSVGWRARVVGRAGYGTVRDAGTYGGQVVFGLVVRRLRLELGGGLEYASSPGSSTLPVFTALRWTTLVRVCGEWMRQSVALHLCGGAAAGQIYARGVTWNSVPSVDVHAAPGLTWWFHSKLGLWLGFSAGVYLNRPEFMHGEEGEQHAVGAPSVRAPPFFGEGAMGLEFRWGP